MKPSHRSRYLFFLMFSIVLLLNIDFTILRSVRNTIAVVNLGTGASSIPFFELFGTLPASIGMTWAFARLMKRMSLQHVFFLTLVVFLGFFLFFALVLYPYLASLQHEGKIQHSLLSLSSMLFYVTGELWKPALVVILFWGLVNQHIPLQQAKKLFAPILLGGSIGSILASPIVSLCTSETIWRSYPLSAEHWSHSLSLMMLMVSAIGVFAAILFHRLGNYFSQFSLMNTTTSNETASLKENITLCLQNPKLRLLSWIVIVDYIAYSLGEVIFLEMLRYKFPNPVDYCNYMGKLSSWNGGLTVFSAIFVTPLILQRCRWVVAALATPVLLLITEGAFFLFLRAKSLGETWVGWTDVEWVGVVVLLGSIQYCVCRAAKYTLFDASKELAFVLMPTSEKMKGKLIIDGICARLGRGGASGLSICLIQLCGGVLASALLSGVIAIGVSLSWLLTTFKLGKLLERDQTIHAEEEERARAQELS